MVQIAPVLIVYAARRVVYAETGVNVHARGALPTVVATRSVLKVAVKKDAAAKGVARTNAAVQSAVRMSAARKPAVRQTTAVMAERAATVQGKQNSLPSPLITS